jgi:glycosyltransferase involved in cell wall biosynthesis
MGVIVSIIIPVYNAERYLTPCIESLLSQTLYDCEFIFVNDGSKDKSRAIIEQYQQLDDRIKLINQPNQGVSMARNIGLSKAVGEYVGFVDADDYIERDLFEVLYTTAKLGDCDVVISNFESELNQHHVITRYPFPTNNVLRKDYIDRELIPYFLKKDDLNTVCSKLYKREIIHNHQVKFPESVVLGEDGLFNLKFFKHAATFQYLDYSGYHYREVEGSATRNSAEKDYFQRALEVYRLDLTEVIGYSLDKDKVQLLKSIKLIHSVMSYIYIYLDPTQGMGFSKRYAFVKNMIGNKQVREALPLYYSEMYSELGRYDKCIVGLMKCKSTLGLLCAASYSRLRNK